MLDQHYFFSTTKQLNSRIGHFQVQARQLTS